MTGTAFRPLVAAVFAFSVALLLYELLLTRIFAVVLFASYAHLALALALLGMSAGATIQHLWPNAVPERGMGRRLGWIGLALGFSTVAAIAASLVFPVLKEVAGTPSAYQDTSFHKDELLNQGWFALLLPTLSLPFGLAGLAIAGAFQRLRLQIGTVYAADLAGGALGALVFVPLLTTIAGPDVSFVVLSVAAVGSAFAFAADGARMASRLSMGVALLGVLATGLGITRGGLLQIGHTVGFGERLVTYTEWTPLVRLAVFEDGDQTLVLLDNTSASQVPMSEEERTKLTKQANRGLVYRAKPMCAAVAGEAAPRETPPGGTAAGETVPAVPGAAALTGMTVGPTPRPCTLPDHAPHVGILAASAGPEVAVAQHFGYSNIEAIDIAGEIFRIVADRFPGSPVNPYLQPGVHRVYSDGRAAILRATEPYDVIQMVHANLWSAAGILANTWSPALLETKEAFTTYLDHLAPDGVISFGRGDQTDAIARSAAAALIERGAHAPWQNIAWVKGGSQVLLVRPRPWTEEERAQLAAALPDFNKAALAWDMAEAKPPKAWKRLLGDEVMTDDRPYVDTVKEVKSAFTGMWSQVSGDAQKPLASLYLSLFIQLAFVLVTGMVFVGAPLLWRGRGEMAGVRGSGWGLAYTAGLGYGYLSIETVLIHELVLFVGHPTWAITVVVLAMLTGSGLGAWYAGALADRSAAAIGPRGASDAESPGLHDAEARVSEALIRPLRLALVSVVVLGIVYGSVVPPALHAFALGWPLPLRIALTFVALAPLGFLMGMPFPLALRTIRPAATTIVPWCWAMNGWMSVLGSLATVVIARLGGYSEAYALAIAAYVLALLFAGRLATVGAPRRA